ncbi:alpha/beta fold hydrolase [Geomonas sp. Red69]|uniref:S10 family peptidase n=1 Tax=Geomonas diazotrophica TaxID=2843197 RepID=UPI001C10DBFB|nr:alpha/beta fold hydrolase [Geomonas diazotrophica]MBU5637561.1 alpha/beta fold hydrolase [Geomonas diazotrophica]
MSKPLLIVSALFFALAQVPAFAAPPSPESKPQGVEQQESQTKPGGTARVVVTSHKAQIGGKEISYQACAGTLPVLTDTGETEAEIFYVSYRVQQPASAKPRPLLFAFNGGPGAASVWLHLGAMGPRRVQMLPDGSMPAPPFRLVDNASSWLDVADLVFVDPVGTGYSRAAKPDLTKKFSAVQGDIDSLGRFVRLYLTRNGLWDTPVFLVGESYGTFRSAGLAEHLVEHGVALNGLILVSSILNLQTVSFDYGNDLPYQLFLPSYTATAWYHRKLAPELQADLDRTLAQAEQWAASDYLLALNKGDRLTMAERKAIAEKLASFTGLSVDLVQNRNLRVDNRDFAKELLRDERRTVGLMDSRFNAENPEPGKHLWGDATIANIRPPFTSAMNTYLREELDYRSDLEYFALGGGIGRWDWEAKNSYADTGENLRNAMVKNPYLKVLVASGLFDLATPHFATDYTLAHLGVGEALRRNISVKRYRSGHMMYLEGDSLAQLKRDATEFIGTTLKR